MRMTIDDIGGVIVKNDDRYIVKDNTHLNNLVVSSTELNPGRKTSGHSHAGQEEVYHFVKGSGMMKIDEQFHQVINDSKGILYFVCVFDGGRKH